MFRDATQKYDWKKDNRIATRSWYEQHKALGFFNEIYSYEEISSTNPHKTSYKLPPTKNKPYKWNPLNFPHFNTRTEAEIIRYLSENQRLKRTIHEKEIRFIS